MTHLARAAASFALCLSLLGVPSPAPAQAEAEPEPAWARECGDARCAVSARLAAEGRDSLFATIVIGFGRDGAAPSIALGVPLGVAVSAGVRLLIDEGTAVDVPVEVCLRDGCRAARDLTPEEARALAEARSLEIRYFAYAAEAPLAAAVSVAGLDEALAELR